jgi:hypothetical protein
MNLPQKLLAQVGVIKNSLDALDSDYGYPVRPASLVRKKSCRTENAILNSN